VAKTVDEGIACLLQEADHHQASVISFDVFGTLIHRKWAPDAVLHTVAKWLDGEIQQRLGRPPLVPAMQAYHTVYAKLASANVACGLDFEVLTSDLYPAWVAEAAGQHMHDGTELAHRLAMTMRQYEVWSCFADPKLRDVLAVLKGKGKRLIYVSDMYCGNDCVRAVLQATGLSKYFDAGYVSSDHALLKRTGNLYRKVMNLEGIRAPELVHIGDDSASDGDSAIETGITAIIIRDSELLRRCRGLDFDWRLFLQDKRWGGFLAAVFAQAGPDELGTPEEAYGRRVLGPIFASFIHKTLERCRSEQVKRVYFVAREGILLKDLYEQLAPLVYGDESPPPAVYLYLSRLTALYLCSRGIGLRELSLTMANGPRNLRNLLSPLELDCVRLAGIANRYGLPDPDANLPDFFLSWPPFIRFLEDAELKEVIETRFRDQSRKAEEYLEQVSFFDDDLVAFVDVGWHGQIQESLFLGMQHRPDCPQIRGLYMGLTLTAHWRKSPDNWMEWTICDQVHMDWPAIAAFHFPQSFEAIARAPHGTVIGYQRLEDGTIQPILNPDNSASRQREIENDPMIMLFQRGIRAFVAQYKLVGSMARLTAEDTLPYAREMIQRMIRFPTSLEARWLLGLRNVSDLGSKDVYLMGSSSRTWSPRKLLWSLPKQLQSSFWKYGTLALHGGRPIQLLWAFWGDARNLPQRDTAIGPGIVFHEPARRKPHQVASAAKSNVQCRNIHLPVADMPNLSDAHCTQGEVQTFSLAMLKATAPLSLGEFLLSWMSLRLAILATWLFRRRPVYSTGLPIGFRIRRMLVTRNVFRQIGSRHSAGLDVRKRFTSLLRNSRKMLLRLWLVGKLLGLPKVV
jgi:FMN phosphatase YigB (HAD superfamily)